MVVQGTNTTQNDRKKWAAAYKYYKAIFKTSSTMLFINYIFLSPLYRCPLNELSNGA